MAVRFFAKECKEKHLKKNDYLCKSYLRLDIFKSVQLIISGGGLGHMGEVSNFHIEIYRGKYLKIFFPGPI